MTVLLIIVLGLLVLNGLNGIRMGLIMNRWIENQRTTAAIVKRHLGDHIRRQEDTEEIDYAAAMTMLAHLRDLHGVDINKLSQPLPPPERHD